MLLETANEPSGGQEAFARNGPMLNARGRQNDDTFSARRRRAVAASDVSPRWTERHYTNPCDRHNLHAARRANPAMFLLLFSTARAKWRAVRVECASRPRALASFQSGCGAHTPAGTADSAFVRRASVMLDARRTPSEGTW